MKEFSQCSVLIVDDNENNVNVLVDTLQELYEISVAMDGRTALKALTHFLPDLILLDVMMPEMDGYEVIRELKADPATMHIPVIFLTALSDTKEKVFGFRLGAVDYITKPFEIEEVLVRVKTHLSLVLARQEVEAQKEFLERKVKERTRELALTQEATIESMAALAEHRDPETGGHIHRIKNYVRLLAEQLAEAPKLHDLLTEEFIDLLTLSSSLHDIGKVAIPDHVLLKPGPLSLEEFEEMKRHAVHGGDAIGIAERRLGKSSFLSLAKEMAYTHHERWNGTGYPRRLKGEEIPISGRILAIADVYDALISKRIYKPSMTHAEAVETICAGAGTQFDPFLVEVFMDLQERFRRVALEHADFDEERESLAKALEASPEPPPIVSAAADPHPTHFLPAEKLAASDVEAQHRLLLGSDLLKLSHVLPIMIVILNSHRQLIYGNPSFLDFLGVLRVEDILGKRLGEAVGCLHPLECNAECGTTDFCRHCGAARALVTSMAGGSHISECRLNQRVGNVLTALNFRVWMSPLSHAGQYFSVGTLIDIYNEKRMEAFERLFFHDLLNTAGAIRSICEIMEESREDWRQGAKLKDAVATFIQQILSHRELMLAERQELSIQPTTLGSRSLLDEQVRLFHPQAARKRISLQIADDSQDVIFSTERTLLGRILGNLIKNALEASEPRESVIIRSRREGDGVLFTVNNPAILSEEVKSGLFKRSFSTRGIGRGLGTYSARLFAETYLKGRIWFKSVEGEGTTFFVHVPRNTRE